MKKSFITGLVILLPVALTLAIVTFFFNLLTVPFLGFVKAVFQKYHLFSTGFLVFTPEGIQNVFAQVLILLTLVLLTVLLGVIARWFLFRTLLHIGDWVVHRIPLVSSVYKICQEVIKTVFASETNSFKQVVMVRYPSPSSLAIGLVTRNDLPGLNLQDSVAVFVPTTPNPTSGFLILYKREELIPVDMGIDEAFKFIVSCGVILPQFQKMDKREPPP